MRWSARLAVLLVLLASIGSAAAQSGGMQIRVLDATEQTPLPGATIELSNRLGLVASTSAIADKDGVVLFPVLKSGSGYVIEVTFPGFAGQRRTDLKVQTGETLRVVVALSLEMRETVQVTAERSVVDLDQTGSSTKFDDTFIENAPVPGRFYQNVLTLAPGVNDSDGDGNPNVHGARTRNFRAEISGISNTDPLTGEWLSRVSTDSIEEIEVLATGAGVEFGRASGGFARILQKQGSNRFEGVFNLIYRSSALDGTGASDFSGEAPDFDWVQPSIQVSGPIVKDRLWYRLTHELIDREDPVVLATRVDVVSRRQEMHSDQITWQVSPRNKLAFLFQSDPLTVENLGLTNRVRSESAQRLERGGQTYSIAWTAPYSPRLLFESQIAFQDHERNLVPMVEGATQDCVLFNRFFSAGFEALNFARCNNTESGRVSGSYHESTRDRRQRFTASGQATYYAGRVLGVNHQAKLGFIVENERYFRDLERGSEFDFFTVTDRFSGAVTGFSLVNVSVPRTTSGKSTGVNGALYVEDQMRLRQNLSLTVGLRVDREEIDSDGFEPIDPAGEAAEFTEAVRSGSAGLGAANRSFTAFGDLASFPDALARALDVPSGTFSLGPAAQSSQFWEKSRQAESVAIRNTNLSPRVAIAWDPWSNGRTKFSATAGRYYDKIFLAVPLIEIEPPRTELTFQSAPTSLGIFFDVGPLGSFSPAVSVQMVQRDLRTPYQDEYSVSFERELWAETSLKLTYIRRNFEDQLQDVDINHAPGDVGRCLGQTNSVGPPVITPSPGVGPVTDERTGEEYEDVDPGPGDGRIDDCTGLVVNEGGPVFGRNFEVADGLPDLYVRNPGWGDILLVGNFNSTTYDAFVVELIRRMYRSWQLDASYVWSRAEGSAEDFTQGQGNDPNLIEDEFGPLAFDQRHVVKVNAVAITPGGFRVGGALSWQSGLPFSLIESRPTVFGRSPEYGSLANLDFRFRNRYPSRQRNDERNPSFWNLDLRVAKEFSLSRRLQLQATLEVFNVFDDDTWRVTERVDGLVDAQRRFGRQYQIGVRIAF